MSAAEQIGPAEIFYTALVLCLVVRPIASFCADLFLTPPVSQARPFFFLHASSLRIHRCI
jgi:hypothetical protein